jgi:1,5-anhydro-D-fructose reductase (1,5-anhydro-D-mannitol-forming)
MIRIGIIGCGRILNAHLQAYKRLRELGVDNFRITALCDLHEDNARMYLRRGEGPAPRPPLINAASGDIMSAPQTYLSDFQEDQDVQLFTDYRDLIDSDNVDAINDLTFVSLHHQIATAAFTAGKHLLTQKPLAITIRAGRQMVDLAQKKGVTFGVFENVRQKPEVRAAAWAARSGLIGKPEIAIMGSLGGIWSRDHVVADTPWRHQKLLAGGGATIDVGVHQIHWLRYILGEEVENIYATVRALEPVRYRRDLSGTILGEAKVDVDDTYIATLYFKNGVLGQLLFSWGLSPEFLDVPGLPVILGSKGSIRGNEIIYDDGHRIPLWEEFIKSLSDIDRENYFPIGLMDDFAIQQYDWLRAIQYGTDPETSAREGLYDLTCAYGMVESSNLNRRVSLDEISNGSVDFYQHEIDEYYGLI